MEELQNGGICPLTGWQIQNVKRELHNWYYTVSCDRFLFNILVSPKCFDDTEISKNRHLIRWLIFSERMMSIKADSDTSDVSLFLITREKIKQIISESFIPDTPKEKSEQLLVLLNIVFPSFKGEISREDLFNLTFFQNEEEFKIYFDFLVDSNFIKPAESSKTLQITPLLKKSVLTFLIEFKYEGIRFLASLEENGRNSKNCFIAMSFSEEPKIKAIKEAIIAALVETKYNSVIISDKHIESDRTINDAIIAEIKRARFVIADFTEQKSGVYFEAGFALGLGIPVIYCCEEEDFKKYSHFDVNHYPHILYKTPEQLRKGLIDKIMAWID